VVVKLRNVGESCWTTGKNGNWKKGVVNLETVNNYSYFKHSSWYYDSSSNSDKRYRIGFLENTACKNDIGYFKICVTTPSDFSVYQQLYFDVVAESVGRNPIWGGPWKESFTPQIEGDAYDLWIGFIRR